MVPRPYPEPFRAEFHRRVGAWRAAVLGVPSHDAAPAGASAELGQGNVVLSPPQQTAFDLQRPRQQFVQPILIGGFIAMYAGAISIPLGWGALGVVGIILGASVAYAISRHRKQLRLVAGRALNAAFNLIGLGRLRDASGVLDAVTLGVKEPWVLRLAGIQRAIIAIRRGEMAPAEACLDAAIEQPVDGFARENAMYQLEGAHALRAFVRAAQGKHDEARADIARVMERAASEDALARVALAEAMILEQTGKREELRMLLGEKRMLLLEHTHPRERAIVRAYQRMVRSDRSSVYRRAETSREKTEGEEPMLADWVAKVAPGAASFVRSTRAAEHAATTAPNDAVVRPSEAAVRANIEAKKPVRRGAAPWKALAYGTTLVAAFGAVYAFLETDSQPAGAAAVAAGASGLANGVAAALGLAVVMIPVIYAVVVGLRALSRRRAEKAVRSTSSSGPAQPTERQLQELAESPSPVVAAQACLMLADRAERSGDFATALSAATRGLARLTDAGDRAAADIVYPDLLSLRAFALAAHGRYEESNAELAALGTAYPHFGRAVFRARLLTLVRAKNLHGAADWIEQGEADLPLSVREELLADLVRATAHPEHAGAGELQRLKDELRTMPEVAAWIRAAAPGLLDAFEGATVSDIQMRVETTATERDHLAEEEAAAALELGIPAARFTH